MDVDKSKKPTVEMEVTCPHCLSLLSIQYWKQRIGDPEPVEYTCEAEAQILRQGRLFPKDEKPKRKGKAAVTKK